MLSMYDRNHERRNRRSSLRSRRCDERTRKVESATKRRAKQERNNISAWTGSNKKISLCAPEGWKKLALGRRRNMEIHENRTLLLDTASATKRSCEHCLTRARHRMSILDRRPASARMDMTYEAFRKNCGRVTGVHRQQEVSRDLTEIVS